MEPELNLFQILRRLMAEEKRANEDLHNAAKALFKKDVKIQFRIGFRDYRGKVVEVIGMPGRTEVRVVNLATLKQRDIRLSDVTGIVQEM